MRCAATPRASDSSNSSSSSGLRGIHSSWKRASGRSLTRGCSRGGEESTTSPGPWRAYRYPQRSRRSSRPGLTGCRPRRSAYSRKPPWLVKTSRSACFGPSVSSRRTRCARPRAAPIGIPDSRARRWLTHPARSARRSAPSAPPRGRRGTRGQHDAGPVPEPPGPRALQRVFRAVAEGPPRRPPPSAHYRPYGKVFARRSDWDHWLAHYRQVGRPDAARVGSWPRCSGVSPGSWR
jgi:hypothetical protein